MAELVKVYKKEDFLDGTEPYEEVYRFVDDKFELDRAIERMAMTAKDVGVRNFKTLFKAYAEKMKMASNADLVENASDFDGQPVELNTGQWTADDHGVSRFNAWGVEVFACVHPILPIERLINIDTGIAKVKIAYKLGPVWRTCIVDKKIIASASSITTLADYGIAVTSESARELVQYLHDVEYLNYSRIPETNSVTRLGWIDGIGFSPYIEDLSYDGEKQHVHMFNAVTQHGSEEKWMEAIKKVRGSGNVPARIILASSFASVMVEPLGCLPFFVHLWGGTGSGKTVGLMMATSVWANPEKGKYWQTFNSTSVAQEVTAGFLNSLPLILDEMQLEKDRKSFDKMVYQLAEGIGRARGSKTGGTQKLHTWQNCILTNGEQPMTTDASGGGAMNRIIEIDCADIQLFDDPVGLVSTLKRNYGHAGKAFISLLTDEVISKAESVYNDTYTALLENATEKQAMAGALVVVADKVATELLFKDGNALKHEDVAQYLLSQEEVDQNKRALEWFRGWLIQNKKRFEWLESDNNIDIWGKRSGNNIMIINHIFKDACLQAGFNPHAFAKWLARKGYLETDPHGRTSKVCNVDGMRSRCYVFNDIEQLEWKEV